MSTEDLRALRSAFGTFMTGVTVVTTLDAEGTPIGFTANSFSSVSLEPPLLLVCLARTSRSYAAFAVAKGFAVNILSEEQTEVSNTFARQVEDRFATVNWRQGPFASPILDGVSAWFDCSTHEVIEAGDHVIMIGRVEAYEAFTTPGLGYVRGAYVTPSQEAQALGHGTRLVVTALIERGRDVLLIDDGAGGLKLPDRTVGKDGAATALSGLIDATGVTAMPGFIYSMFDDTAHGHQNIAFLCNATEGEPAQGVFRAVTAETLARVSDPAVRTMLERFASESRLGNYGIYFGNQQSGQVRPVTPGGKA